MNKNQLALIVAIQNYSLPSLFYEREEMNKIQPSLSLSIQADSLLTILNFKEILLLSEPDELSIQSDDCQSLLFYNLLSYFIEFNSFPPMHYKLYALRFKNFPWNFFSYSLNFLKLWFDALFNEKMFFEIFDPALFYLNILFLYKNNICPDLNFQFFIRPRNLDLINKMLQKIDSYIDSGKMSWDECLFKTDIRPASLAFKEAIVSIIFNIKNFSNLNQYSSGKSNKKRKSVSKSVDGPFRKKARRIKKH